MARKKSPTLTDGELRLMEVLWTKGRATVAEVAEVLKDDPAPAYTTVLTLLRILEQKGYVRHEKDGRAFIYEPVIAREDACRDAVKHLVSRFFDNSPELLLLNLLEERQLDAKELRRLRKLIEETK